MKTIGSLLTTLIALFVFAVSMTLAKGSPVEARINVPGRNPITVSEERALQALATFSFEDYNHPVVVLEQLGVGVEITRYMAENQSKSIEWDRVIYFPHNGGEIGYAYYVGLVDHGDDSEGQWYRVSKAGEDALWAILNAHYIDRADLHGTLVERVDLGNANPQQPALAGMAGITALAGLGLGWLLGRRNGRK